MGLGYPVGRLPLIDSPIHSHIMPVLGGCGPQPWGQSLCDNVGAGSDGDEFSRVVVEFHSGHRYFPSAPKD